MTATYFGLWAGGVVTGSIAGIVVLWKRRAFTWTTFMAGVLAVAGFIVGVKLQYRIEQFPLTDALRLSVFELLEPGERLPLGLLLGGVLAGLWCLALRAPWRDVGDALAVGATTMIPIGRIGCWLNGCCMGKACGRWALPVCVRFSPGTESYNQQLGDNLIVASDTVSLPAHPLPLYFAAGALAILAIQIWMFRRKAAPGMMLATACILGSAGKLALETLRANPRPPGLMFIIPTGVLVVTSAALALAVLRRLAAGRARRIAVAAKVPVVGLVLATLTLGGVRANTLAADAASESALGAAPATSPAMDALAAYARDPVKNRAVMRQLERQGTEALPPVVLIALADARLRSGQRRAASRLFEEVLARDPGEPFVSWARLGLGWNALLAGDVDAARPYLEEIAAAGTATSGLAKLLVALIDAGDGKPVAVGTFDQVAADRRVSPGLREVARLGGAYARYWTGDFRGAATAFEAVAREYPESKLDDDAQYGAAWSRVRAGERGAGEAALRSLAGDAPKYGAAVSEALVNLDQRALLRASFRRYRRGPLRAPEDQVAELLDGDGRAMARAALAYLNDAPLLATASLRRAVPVSHQADAEDRGNRGASGVLPAREALPARQTAASPASGGGHRRWYALVAAILAACLLVVTRRHGTRPSRGARKWVRTGPAARSRPHLPT